MFPFLLAALLAVPAKDDRPVTNTLTPKEAADGWLLLFDGKSTFGWTTAGEVKVEDGALVLGGKQATRAVFNTPFDAFDLQFEHQAQGSGAVLGMARGKTFASFGLGSGASWTPVRIVSTSQAGAGARYQTVVFRRENDAWKKVAESSAASSPGAAQPAQLSVEVPAGSQVRLQNVKLKPLNQKSLFNGKDLTGWKVFPGKKSTFAVVDGAINVKDGPGDLQTEEKFGDFVLQVECISHGKNLNSGVFFRCREGEYQNGYEAQVRNQFTPGSPQTYVIEKYDPQTHKLIAKEKIQSPAVDFGTGAIYRRMPARVQASKDGEWFTLTVAAHGNHFATWVNGVQQVDWTDNRPPSDNARTGFRRAPGHLSIQGHDPTTNLSFRNWRIAAAGK